jgi:PAS domain S-box-containing protein
MGSFDNIDRAAERESAALFEESAEELYENAPAGYLSSLPDGTVVKVNATFLAWTGYCAEDVVGAMRLRDLLPPGARIYYETHYAPLIQMQGSVRGIAVEIVCAGGRRLPVLMNSTLVRDTAGTPRIVRTTMFDASDRRRYEQELLRARAYAETRARAALALAHVNDGVFLVDDDGRVSVANAAAEAILGVGGGEAVGRAVAELIPEWETLADRIPVGGAGERIPPAILPLARGGHEQWLAAAAVDSGEGIVYTIRDVTVDRRLEQLRGDLLAIVSHELRTPATGTYGAAQTLLAHWHTLDDDRRRQLLELIVQQGERLTRILDDILLTSALDSGNLALEVETFDASELVTAVLDAVETSATRSRVVVDAEPGICVRGDVDRVRQVLANLLDNALKYSARAVSLTVAAERSRARFIVADNGPGVPAAERERIFEKFYRLDPYQHGGVGGTGLGLYIAKELVVRMDGSIGLTPRDEGTTVFVDLPLAD